jgi:hypothetical protein
VATLGLLVAAFFTSPEHPIGVVDCFKETLKTRAFVDWPSPVEARAKELEFVLREQAQRNDPTIGH